jgi:hypothetical protein
MLGIINASNETEKKGNATGGPGSSTKKSLEFFAPSKRLIGINEKSSSNIRDSSNL